MGLKVILSKRLKAVTDLLPKGNIVADIGCDHGYISISLIESGKYNRALAMDLRKGPLSIAKDNISKAGFTDEIETRLSDGLEKLNSNEADAAIIAGMGGLLVISILERSIDKAKNMKYLVLQPQSDIEKVRIFLRDNAFSILKEDMVKDEGKYYPMFLVSCNKEIIDNYSAREELDINLPNDSDISLEDLQTMYDYYGKELIINKNAVLVEFIEHEKDVFESVIAKLPKDNHSRMEEIKYRLKLNSICMKLINNNNCK